MYQPQAKFNLLASFAAILPHDDASYTYLSIRVRVQWLRLLADFYILLSHSLTFSVNTELQCPWFWSALHELCITVRLVHDMGRGKVYCCLTTLR